MLLAFDTSTSLTSVALYHERGLVAEESWQSGGDQTTQLLPEIDHLMARMGLTPDQLRGIAVGLGPGSFNALRVGVSAAKGLALGLDLPIFGVPSLDAVAEQYAGVDMPVVAMVPAGRGRIAAALYQSSGPAWQLASEYRNMTVEELCAGIAERTIFAGEMDEAVTAEIGQRLGSLAVIPPAAAQVRRAGFVAQLAWPRLEHGESDDRASLQPLYLAAPAIGKRKQV
jgi:tRNA threonylcarbamoyladenosine biosynthesis protein TsaB